MNTEYGIQDPIVLDRKYKEIHDDSRTRGEIFWNTNNVFYFISRNDWENFYSEPDCKFHQIKLKKVNHTTYFDKNRPTYYKYKESNF